MSADDPKGPEPGPTAVGDTNSGRAAAGAAILIAGLLLLGGVAYQFSAKPAGEGAPGAAQPAAPTRVNAEIAAAIAKGKDGDLQAAAAALAAIVDANPDNTDARFNYGIALGGLEKYDQADAQFRKILEKRPKDFDAIAERASLFAQAGQAEDAVKLLETIPVGEGQVRHRLEKDPRWRPLAASPRLRRVRERHGLPPPGSDY